MGTSSSNPGQKGNTPLIPSWVDDDRVDLPVEDKPVPPLGNKERFRHARKDFTEYIKSSGKNTGNLHRATSNYVRRSLGGASNATQRLGAAKRSSARLVSVLGRIAANGLRATLEHHGFRDLIGKPVDQVFLGLVDYICPDGGRVDEGIARNAFIDILPLIKDMGIDESSGLNESQLRTIMEVYFSNVIMQRLINDIGKNTFRLPQDMDEISSIESQLSEFIQGTVSDAIARLGVDFKEMTDQSAREVIDQVYYTAYTVLEDISQEAGD